MKIFISFLILISCFSCKREGCKDCSATNFDSKAKNDDNSCSFLNEELHGIYVVNDSITGPPTLDWEFRTYNITVSNSTSCTAENISISNFAGLNNSFSGDVFTVDCETSNNTITVGNQSVNNKNVRNTTGRFVGDSIYLDIEFENSFGEVFYGSCYGKRE